MGGGEGGGGERQTETEATAEQKRVDGRAEAGRRQSRGMWTTEAEAGRRQRQKRVDFRQR